MLTLQQVWQRLRLQDAFKGMSENDFREAIFVQKFANIAAQQVTAVAPQSFPGGAVILGITATGFKGNVALTAQGGNNRQCFGLGFAYTTNEALVINGPVAADALLGGGDSNIFPSKEILMSANQALQVVAENYTSDLLTVHIAYHCLVYRFT